MPAASAGAPPALAAVVGVDCVLGAAACWGGAGLGFFLAALCRGGGVWVWADGLLEPPPLAAIAAMPAPSSSSTAAAIASGPRRERSRSPDGDAAATGAPGAGRAGRGCRRTAAGGEGVGRAKRGSG